MFFFHTVKVGAERPYIKGLKATVTIHYLIVISMCLMLSRSLPLMFRFAIAALFLSATSPAFGQGMGTPAEGEILAGWRENSGVHIAGFSIRLAKGWKTYWRAPGDGGIPPRFNWSGSRNLAGVEVRYPIPEVMDQNGIRSVGYHRNVIFPLLVNAQDRSKPIHLTGEIELGVCEEICIPITLKVQALLPAVGVHDAAIANEMNSQPSQAGTVTCDIEPIADGLRLRTTANLARMKGEAAVIEGGGTGVWVSPPVLTRSGKTLIAEVEMVPPNAKPFALARSDIRLTVIGNGRAVEFLGCN